MSENQYEVREEKMANAMYKLADSLDEEAKLFELMAKGQAEDIAKKYKLTSEDAKESKDYSYTSYIEYKGKAEIFRKCATNIRNTASREKLTPLKEE